MTLTLLFLVLFCGIFGIVHENGGTGVPLGPRKLLTGAFLGKEKLFPYKSRPLLAFLQDSSS